MFFDVNKLKVRFKIKYPDFSYIVDKLEIVIDTKETTAATDGEKLYFNPEYMNNLSEEQQLFVFAHEVLHVAFDHIDRSEGKNHYNWNIATDAVINAYLCDDGLKQPEGTVDIAGALNYYAEQIYEKLQKRDEEKKREKENQTPPKESDKRGTGKEIESNSPNSDNNNDKKENENGNGQSSNDNNDDKEENKDDVGHDSHSRWEEAAKKHRKERKERGENPEPNKNVNEKEEFKKNKERRKQKNEEYLGNGNYISSPSLSEYGNGSRGTSGDLDEYKYSPIDWKRLLKDSVTSDYDWDTSYLEEEDGVIVPEFRQQPKPKTEIVIDSSGSISETLIKNFLKECMSIINTSETDVGFFDDYFYGFERITDENDITNLEVKGGGGTNFDVAISAFTNRAENKIVFTDGACSNPKKYCDAIWVVVGPYKNKIHPPGGKVIYITGKDYEDLCTPRYSRRR